MFLLNALLSFLAVLISWNVTLRPRLYFADAAARDCGGGRVLVARFLPVLLFWELELAPMFLLIGIWGSASRVCCDKFILYGDGQRLHAAGHLRAVPERPRPP
jgi:NAD(P)H-quinone oxidoreductase subunit 4